MTGLNRHSFLFSDLSFSTPDTNYLKKRRVKEIYLGNKSSYLIIHFIKDSGKTHCLWGKHILSTNVSIKFQKKAHFNLFYWFILRDEASHHESTSRHLYTVDLPETADFALLKIKAHGASACTFNQAKQHL